MSNREIDRLKVIQNTIDGKFTWLQAAQTLSLSGRQVGRLCVRVRKAMLGYGLYRARAAVVRGDADPAGRIGT